MLLLLAACREAPDEAPTPVDEQPVITVEGGFGGGPRAVGAPAHVWAAVDPRAAIVTGWTGDAALLDTPSEWNSGLEMPDRDVVLGVTIEPVDAPLEARSYPLANGERDTLGVRVPSPVGVVLFFHGAAYSVDQLRDAAARTITLHLARAGYSVVALESEAEARAGTGGWDASLAGNADLDNVASLIELLRADGTLPDGVPWFAAGMSSGGMFAHAVGAALDPAGVAAWCAAGSSEALAATDAPTAWFLAEADQTFPSAASEAAAHQQQLAARDVPALLLVHPPTPLYGERFLRVEGVDFDRSVRIAEALRAAGAVGDDDRWTATGSSVTRALDDLDGIDGLDPAQRAAVAAEIEVMAADHELYDDVAARMVGFLDSVR